MPVFKSKTLQEPGPKKRMWKSLKQIQTTERNVFGINSDAVLCKSTAEPSNLVITLIVRIIFRFHNQRAAIVSAAKKIFRHQRSDWQLL